MNMLSILDKVGQRLTLAISLALLILIVGIDYLTTYEIAFSVFYLIPISLVAWNNGKLQGYYFSALTISLWLIHDLLAHEFLRASTPYLNSFYRFIVFFFVVFLLDSLKKSRTEQEIRIEERTRDLVETALKLGREMLARKKLERNILEISEEEQARIGRELHDDLGQLLTGVAYLAGALSSRLASIDQEGSEKAGEIKKVAQDAVKRTRYISHGLMPFNVLNQGLNQGLEQLASDVTALFGIPCEFQYSGQAEVSDFTTATHLYRISQEAINNAVKYSSATRMLIQLSTDANEICLIIADNGVGMPEDLLDEGKGIGMLNMKYRAQIIGATISLDTKVGKGTKIKLVIPMIQP